MWSASKANPPQANRGLPQFVKPRVNWSKEFRCGIASTMFSVHKIKVGECAALAVGTLPRLCETCSCVTSPKGYFFSP